MRTFRGRSPILSIVVAAAFLLNGCLPPRPVNRFPTFSSHETEHRRVAIVSEILVLHDAIGTTDAASAKENMELGRLMNSALETELERSSYTVVSSTLAAIGIAYSTASFRVKLSDMPDRQIGALPLFVDPFYANDPTRLFLLDHTIGRLEKFQFQNVQATAPVCTEIQSLVPQDVDDVAILIAWGRTVPGIKQFGSMMGTALLSAVALGGAGFIGYSKTSYFETSFHIVDAKTGHVEWSDNLITKAMDRKIITRQIHNHGENMREKSSTVTTAAVKK